MTKDIFINYFVEWVHYYYYYFLPFSNDTEIYQKYFICQFNCNGIRLLLIIILFLLLSWYFEKILLILNNTCKRVYNFIFLPLGKWLKKKNDLKCMHRCINVPKEKYISEFWFFNLNYYKIYIQEVFSPLLFM